jgi:hypothetical protein
MPAGATPIPLRPKTTVTGPFTFVPSLGDTMYTSAPAADGSRASDTSDRARQATVMPRRADFRVMGDLVMKGDATSYPRMASNTTVNSRVAKAVTT